MCEKREVFKAGQMILVSNKYEDFKSTPVEFIRYEGDMIVAKNNRSDLEDLWFHATAFQRVVYCPKCNNTKYMLEYKNHYLCLECDDKMNKVPLTPSFFGPSALSLPPLDGPPTVKPGSSVITPKPDMVNKPPHYTSHPSGVECIQIAEHMGFCIGNAIKYLWRADEKHNDGGMEDLKKAEYYIKREIARREKSSE